MPICAQICFYHYILSKSNYMPFVIIFNPRVLERLLRPDRWVLWSPFPKSTGVISPIAPVLKTKTDLVVLVSICLKIWKYLNYSSCSIPMTQYTHSLVKKSISRGKCFFHFINSNWVTYLKLKKKKIKYRDLQLSSKYNTVETVHIFQN